MGLLSLITGMIAVCISWVPHVGWGAVALGLFSIGVGLILVTSRDAKELHWQYGTFGIILSLIGVAHALAYGIKYQVPGLSELLWSVDWKVGLVVLGGCALVSLAAGLFGRFKNRVLGCIIAALGLLAFCYTGTSVLFFADRTIQNLPPI